MVITKHHNNLIYPEDFHNQIICGDALEIIEKLPDGSIDTILTDPPYGIAKKEIKNSENLETFYKILPQCHRVLKNNGFFITFFSTKLLPQIFANNPFNYFWQFILYCPLSSVRSPIGFSKYMSCVVFKKGNPKMSRWKKDIFVDTPSKMIEPDEGFINHPSPKPKTFLKEILSMFSKEQDIILDPFVGSGSTALACKQTNRKYIGFEIDREYCELTESRLNNFKVPANL